MKIWTISTTFYSHFCVLLWFTEPGYVATVSAMVQAAVTLLNELHSLPRRSVYLLFVLLVLPLIWPSLSYIGRFGWNLVLSISAHSCSLLLSLSLLLTGEGCTHQELPSIKPVSSTVSISTASSSQSETTSSLLTVSIGKVTPPSSYSILYSYWCYLEMLHHSTWPLLTVSVTVKSLNPASIVCLLVFSDVTLKFVIHQRVQIC